MRACSDERLTLSPPQAALLCCIRLWGATTSLHGRIAELCSQLGADTAAEDLLYFLRLIGRETLSLACVCRPTLTDDERALLAILALAQHRARFEALLRLRELVPAAAAGVALDHAEEVGAALARAGHFLDVPEESHRHFALTAGVPPGVTRH